MTVNSRLDVEQTGAKRYRRSYPIPKGNSADGLDYGTLGRRFRHHPSTARRDQHQSQILPYARLCLAVLSLVLLSFSPSSSRPRHPIPPAIKFYPLLAKSLPQSIQSAAPSQKVSLHISPARPRADTAQDIRVALSLSRPSYRNPLRTLSIFPLRHVHLSLSS